jgi:hypothetical protein
VPSGAAAGVGDVGIAGEALAADREIAQGRVGPAGSVAGTRPVRCGASAARAAVVRRTSGSAAIDAVTLAARRFSNGAASCGG